MSAHVEWLLETKIADGKRGDLDDLMARMVKATFEDEPGTLTYEWYVTDDNSRCLIIERYTDSDAALVHLGNFGANFAGEFLSLVTPERFTVMGQSSDALREALAAFGAEFVGFSAGFHRGA